jgi:hypothetical protein
MATDRGGRPRDLHAEARRALRRRGKEIVTVLERAAVLGDTGAARLLFDLASAGRQPPGDGEG